MYEGCNVSKQLRTLTYIHPFIHTYSYLPYITHLTAKPSRMIGVQVGVVLCCVLVARATHTPTYTLNTYLRKLESWDQYGGMCVLVFMSRAPDTHTNTDQHKHRHVTTPKGAKRLLKMACNKVCMTARGKMVMLDR